MISVCLATYNGEKYIKAQIESILKQLGEGDEIVISDDGSIDNTIHILKGIEDSRVKIFYNKGEKGYTKNFENAIKNSIGDYLFLSDQDDIWESNKVEIFLSCLKDAEFVTSDALFVDQDLNSLGQTFFELRGGKQGFLNNLYISQYLGACIAFKKILLKKLLPFPSQVKLCPHDLWISLTAEFYFKVKVVHEPLIKYRRHINNVSNGGLNSTNSLFKRVRFRTYCLYQILLRIFK